VWIAKVDETYVGEGQLWSSEKSGKWQDIDDPAFILAIFRGVPYCASSDDCHSLTFGSITFVATCSGKIRYVPSASISLT
jgi:hypothetical protein